MQADIIKEIISKIDKLPYKCILFDGKWGIGKTYAVNEALTDTDNVCHISMFGLQNSQQIYHEIISRLMLLNIPIDKFKGIMNGISVFSEKAKNIKEVMREFINEKEIFLEVSKKFISYHIIVIDDLERISGKIGLEEVLGIVEELKKCDYVKVILVANTEEMSENKDILDKYEEKVIDRIYRITEKSSEINWGSLGIDADFIRDFLVKHDVKNLRTLQKAQNFYEDVKSYCQSFNNDSFIQEVRLICFAIVIESVDNLYYKPAGEDEDSQEKHILQHLDNNFDYRIINYLSGIRSSQGLVQLIIQYYNDEKTLNKELLQTEYALFVKAGNKANYYKSDEEIKLFLTDCKAQIRKTDNLAELNRLAEEYVYFGDIIDEDTSEVVQIYEEKVYSMLLENAYDGNIDLLSYSYYEVGNGSSRKIAFIYDTQCKKVRETMVEYYIDYLVQSTSDRKAFEYSYILRKYSDNFFYKDILKEKVKRLYGKKSFPIDDMNEDKYHTCYNIMSVLYHFDEENFLEYCDNLSCDKMAYHRLQKMVEEIVKEIPV